jgi:hypothetical protein
MEYHCYKKSFYTQKTTFFLFQGRAKKMPPLRKKRKISTARKQLSQQQLKGVKLSPEEIEAHMRCGFCHQAGTRDILQAGNLYSLRTDKVSKNASCLLQGC